MMSSPGAGVETVANGLRTDSVAAAAERRAREQTNADPSVAQFSQERATRQEFRRLLDPGILRPNSKEKAFASIKTLLTLAENLLREPENSKFTQFKTTNSVIKRQLVEVKGALEYAVALGFRAEVHNFQPLYVFNKRKMNELRIGSSILKEHIERETEKNERVIRSGAAEKAARDAAARNVLLAFEDDRKTKALADRLEKERLGAIAAAAANSEPPVSPDPQPIMIPGSGISLAGHVYEAPPAVDSKPSSPTSRSSPVMMPGGGQSLAGHVHPATSDLEDDDDDESD